MTNHTHEIIDVQQTTCCIVGGGPAGVVLGLLLARQGIPVTLLELHQDFDRDFRGDTIHPSVMEIMAQIGLADRLLELPHSKVRTLKLNSPTGDITLTDFSRLKTAYPYITILPQAKFLEFIATEAQQYPNFNLIMGANVQEIIEEDRVVSGIRYRGHGGWHEVRALLTVGADGRFSRMRQLAGFEPIKTSPPMDVMWFRLPRKSEEPNGLSGRVGNGKMVVLLDRSDFWQVGYMISKGAFAQLRTAGIDFLRKSLVELVPEFSDRSHLLQDWSNIAFLSVESSRLPKWYLPGLLFIGDAAHVMSPVAGVGINYAIQDAVAATNILSEPLKRGSWHLWDLAEVQRQREFPTRVIQWFQELAQKRIIARALNQNQQFTIPAFLRLPILRDIPPRLIAFGIAPVRLNS
ncbi:MULTISPECIES: FAD-dependent oxidoreductase [unclassified Okeania]|uniref:FAD-dependent oxidoreductase n=1 Tax=unclassified Okeania TaxID=2634635 RepID=UPI0013B5B697|nr:MULTISPECIES: FAD-dependent oxidoreductase [unclassified Okeania]NES76235.1 FAD-dependent oxidoreductase [Okeania sp. SIO1H4]NET15039.1 FAD-dependent oxidoreductase [Okeania sp. SIO1H6]NET19677.1 FAD-dependent oxidoreductase [Okeania sp. SIO1H5]NET93603.1 FAD-dependent oxidoreductase [Okeania sp. SIO1H2]